MNILELTKMWQREGQWSEVEPIRDELMKEARRSGLDKADAQAKTYATLAERFPSKRQVQGGEEAGGAANRLDHADSPDGQTRTRAAEAAVTGLDAIPEDWPTLPANATLAQEIQWVQANRLSVVRDLGDHAVVDLTKAMTPAPSWAALGWLETSIRAYAKYVDVAAKASATLEDERETTRRERLAIDEIRSLLADMASE